MKKILIYPNDNRFLVNDEGISIRPSHSDPVDEIDLTYASDKEFDKLYKNVYDDKLIKKLEKEHKEKKAEIDKKGKTK